MLKSKKKILNVLLLASSLIGYLEWGKEKSSFLFQMEYDILFGAAWNPSNFLHPLILLPFIGQLVLIVSLFQKTPGKVITLSGVACLSTIMLMILLAGSLAGNFRIVLSSLPFLITAGFVLREHRKKSPEHKTE